jgi:hypothetical protein
MAAALEKADEAFYKALDSMENVTREDLRKLIRKTYCTPELGELSDDEVRR